MDRIERILTRVLETVVTACFGVIFVLTVLLVILRYLFNSSIIGGNEAMEYLFIYTTALGAAVAVIKGEHISIRYFLNLLSEPLRSIVDALGWALVAMLSVIITLLSRNWILKVGSSESPVMRVPMWAVQMIIPIGCLLTAAYCLILIVRILRTAASRRGAR